MNIYDLERFYKNAVKGIDEAEEKNDFPSKFYESFFTGSRTVYQKQQTDTKKFDDIWIKTIESYFPSINKITINVKSNLKYLTEIIPVEKAKKISKESVVHLTSHTQYIHSYSEEEGVMPKKILTNQSEIEYGIYENRFIMTLINRLKDYVSRRIKIIKESLKTEKVIRLNLTSNFNYDGAAVDLQLDLKQTEPSPKRAADEHNEQLLARAEKLLKLITRLQGGQFMQIMKKYKPVNPPIMKTQIILKNPDFKNAYHLWLFLDKTPELGFDLDSEVVNKRFSPDYTKHLNQIQMLIFSTLLAHDNRSKDASANGKVSYKETKAQVLTKMAGESDKLPEAYGVEGNALNEYYLNKSKQILKKQFDSYVEQSDGDSRLALKKALEDTLKITNALYYSYFEINADDDIFKRLIKESSPSEMLSEAYEKYNIAKSVREVKEQDFDEALKLEAKWQKELTERQQDYIGFEAEEAKKAAEGEIKLQKEKVDAELMQITNDVRKEKENYIKEQKVALALYEKRLKEDLRKDKERVRQKAKEQLFKQRERLKMAAALRKEKERERAKKEKERTKQFVKAEREKIRLHTQNEKNRLKEKKTINSDSASDKILTEEVQNPANNN